MGWVVDHTGKARFSRPGYWGPRFRWPPNPKGPEIEIRFAGVDPPPPSLPTRRALICSTAAIGALGARMTMDDIITLAHFTYGPGARIELGNKPGEW